MFNYKSTGEYEPINIIENFNTNITKLVRKPIIIPINKIITKPITTVTKPITTVSKLITPVSKPITTVTKPITTVTNLLNIASISDTTNLLNIASIPTISQITPTISQITPIPIKATPAQQIACYANTNYMNEYKNNIPYSINQSSPIVLPETQLNTKNNLLILPKNDYNLYGSVYNITNIFNGFELNIKNPLNNNFTIDNIQYNFFHIINTKYLSPNGTIQLNSNNKHQQLVLIQSLNKNIMNKYDSLNNMCNDNYTNNNFIYNIKSTIAPNNIINYNGNPNIFIIADISPCNPNYIGDTIKDNVNIYIYLDYDTNPQNTNPNNTNLALKELSLTNILISNPNNKDNIINPFYNGFINTLDCSNNNNFIFNLTPSDLINGFITVINTYNSNCTASKQNTGLISISNNVLTTLKKQNNCVVYNFYLTHIDFLNPVNYIDTQNIIGPYKSITYTGTPKIVIYIPPFSELLYAINIYINFIYQ